MSETRRRLSRQCRSGVVVESGPSWPNWPERAPPEKPVGGRRPKGVEGSGHTKGGLSFATGPDRCRRNRVTDLLIHTKPHMPIFSTGGKETEGKTEGRRRKSLCIKDKRSTNPTGPGGVRGTHASVARQVRAREKNRKQAGKFKASAQQTKK